MYNGFNTSLNFRYEIYSEFNLQETNTYYNVKVVSHEMGHGFGAYHTFQPTMASYGGVNITLLPNCQQDYCDSDVECKTIMSYCGLNDGLQLKFHPARMSDMYNYINNFGGHLFCDEESAPIQSQIILSITETNLISPENFYTVSFKSCTASTYEYQYGFMFSYTDFPLTILISDLQTQLISDCYDFLITEILTFTECVSTVDSIAIGDLDSPSPLLSPPSPTPVETGIRTLFVKYNSL
jgi:hypothetical protein